MTDFAVSAPDLSRQGKRGAKPAGCIRLGSDDHLRLFCLELLETHDPYKPAVIDWPKLDEVTRNRIVSLPIWDIAVQT
ncbi:MAG: ferritin-like protein, partial [Phenylobacterium sp.]|nr:ferritin-like protein [Phenylobacterium sp.]